MSNVSMRDMLEAGVHFGHQPRFWSPKMLPYIFGERNKIHIVNLEKTLSLYNEAIGFVQRMAANRGTILFVGTKRQAFGPIAEVAESCGMPYVNERWLGGTLTNYRTIRSRLQRLEELEALEENGEMASFSKKRQSSLIRERRKIHRNLAGIRDMERLPEAILVVDQGRQYNCVREARILGINLIARIDTDSDPDPVDLPIPGNDDSIRSIRLILEHLASSVNDGKSLVPQEKPVAKKDEPKAVPTR